MQVLASLVLVLSLIAFGLSACSDNPNDPSLFGKAGPNTYCGNGVYGTVDKNGAVHCPND